MKVPSLQALAIATVAVRRGRLRAGLLLRAARRRPGLHPEDLLPARAAGDLRAGRLHGRRRPRDPPPAHAATRSTTPAPTSRSTSRSSSASRVLITGAIWAQGLVGRLVGLGRADPGQLPDRLPALRDLLPAALLDRGPRPPGPLRLGVRDHRRRLRAAQLPRRAARRAPRPPAHLRHGRGRPARRDAARLPRLPGRDGAALGDAGPLRAGRQGRLGASSRACAARSSGEASAPRRRLADRPGVAARQLARSSDRSPDARAAARRGREVRRRRLPRLPRPAPDLRRDHGRQARSGSSASCGELADLAEEAGGRRADERSCSRSASPTRPRRWSCASAWR